MTVEIHDEYGCSRHDGLVACLGYTPGAGGSSAQRGSELHHIAETIIKSGWKPYKFPDLFENGELFTNEHRNIVLDYTDQIKRLYDHYYEKYGEDLVMEIEKQVAIPSLEIAVSTIDAIFYVPFTFIHIVDFKTGLRPVSPTSAQLRSYTLGALAEGPAKQFAASICQPTVNDGLLTVTYTLEEIKAHQAMMEGILKAAKRENAPCTPCAYCDWCARNGECPATKAKLAMIAIDCDKKELSMQTLAQLTAYAMDIEGIIGSLKQRAYAVLEAGGRLPLPDGRELALVDGRPSRVWRNEKEARSMLEHLAQTKLGLQTPEEIEKTIYEFKEPVMLSPAKAEGVFGKSKAVKAEIDPMVFTKEGNKKLGIIKQAEGEVL